MKPIKRTLISIRTGGHTIDLCINYLDKASFKVYRRSHQFPKSMFYRPTRWEYTIELWKRAYSVNYKRDL